MLTDRQVRLRVLRSEFDESSFEMEGETVTDLMAVMADGEIDDWRERAACQAVTADLFFPIGRTGDALDHIEAAKRICLSCPVQAQCLRFALETNQEAGIWGGTSEEERTKLRKDWLACRRRVSQRTAP